MALPQPPSDLASAAAAFDWAEAAGDAEYNEASAAAAATTTLPWNRPVAIFTHLHSAAVETPTPVTPTVVLVIVAPVGGSLPAPSQPSAVGKLLPGGPVTSLCGLDDGAWDDYVVLKLMHDEAVTSARFQVGGWLCAVCAPLWPQPEAFVFVCSSC